ncbi:hypothetical protein H5410_062580 [Solanum commersonii]|uniref:Uncharacterized protein n=1 Tax=Solanum commersonii TaxID=4109 RepID=A0A9J5WD32_SOLCO|nr:hypothetical protein H5410_062580 [Solanum commersonii]
MEHSEKLPNGGIFGKLDLLVRYDYAEYDGAFLEKLKDDTPFLGCVTLESQSIKVSYSLLDFWDICVDQSTVSNSISTSNETYISSIHRFEGRRDDMTTTRQLQIFSSSK